MMACSQRVTTHFPLQLFGLRVVEASEGPFWTHREMSVDDALPAV